jgi:hypothetical protein
VTSKSIFFSIAQTVSKHVCRGGFEFITLRFDKAPEGNRERVDLQYHRLIPGSRMC